MFRSTILAILDDVWPMLLLFTVVITSFRIVYIKQNKQPFIFYRDLLGLGAILYILCLFYVVTFQDVSWSSSNFIPFQEMFRYQLGSRLFLKNVVGNMLMFLPYGFFVSYFLQLKKPWSIFLLSLLCSCTIETIQLVIGRVFDVDDILLNVVGGMIGYILYCLIKKCKQKMPVFLNKTWIYNILILGLVSGGILYILKVLELGF